MSSVVDEQSVDAIGYGFDQAIEKVSSDGACGFLVQADNGELGRLVYGHEHVEEALLDAHLVDVDAELADGVGFESLPGRSGPFEIRLPGDVVALEQAVKTGSHQMRDARLPGVETVIERQESMSPKSQAGGLSIGGEDG